MLKPLEAGNACLDQSILGLLAYPALAGCVHLMVGHRGRVKPVGWNTRTILVGFKKLVDIRQMASLSPRHGENLDSSSSIHTHNSWSVGVHWY